MQLTKANSRYIFVGCSLRLNIKPTNKPMERMKATIKNSGLQRSIEWLRLYMYGKQQSPCQS